MSEVMKELLDPEEIPPCPHCDQPIEYNFRVMTAHGMYYLACGHCAEHFDKED